MMPHIRVDRFDTKNTGNFVLKPTYTNTRRIQETEDVTGTEIATASYLFYARPTERARLCNGKILYDKNTFYVLGTFLFTSAFAGTENSTENPTNYQHASSYLLSPNRIKIRCVLFAVIFQ